MVQLTNAKAGDAARAAAPEITADLIAAAASFCSLAAWHTTGRADLRVLPARAPDCDGWSEGRIRVSTGSMWQLVLSLLLHRPRFYRLIRFDPFSYVAKHLASFVLEIRLGYPFAPRPWFCRRSLTCRGATHGDRGTGGEGNASSLHGALRRRFERSEATEWRGRRGGRLVRVETSVQVRSDAGDTYPCQDVETLVDSDHFPSRSTGMAQYPLRGWTSTAAFRLRMDNPVWKGRCKGRCIRNRPEWISFLDRMGRTTLVVDPTPRAIHFHQSEHRDSGGLIRNRVRSTFSNPARRGFRRPSYDPDPSAIGRSRTRPIQALFQSPPRRGRPLLLPRLQRKNSFGGWPGWGLGSIRGMESGHQSSCVFHVDRRKKGCVSGESFLLPKEETVAGQPSHTPCHPPPGPKKTRENGGGGCGPCLGHLDETHHERQVEVERTTIHPWWCETWCTGCVGEGRKRIKEKQMRSGRRKRAAKTTGWMKCSAKGRDLVQPANRRMPVWKRLRRERDTGKKMGTRRKQVPNESISPPCKLTTKRSRWATMCTPSSKKVSSW